MEMIKLYKKVICIIIVIIVAVIICLTWRSTNKQEVYPEFKVLENDELGVAELHYNGIIYLPFGASSSKLRGQQIGIRKDEPQSEIYEVKGFDSDEWILEYHNVLMGTYMLWKATDVNDIPFELKQYNQYNY